LLPGAAPANPVAPSANPVAPSANPVAARPRKRRVAPPADPSAEHG
jgi:hypothetical protein